MAGKASRTGRRAFLKAAGAASAAGTIGLAGCIGGVGGGGDGGPVQLTYGGTDQGGAIYQMALTWGQEVKRETDSQISMNIQTTGGLDANVRQVSGGQLDMASTTTPNFQAADTGTRPFNEEHDINPLFTSAVFPFPIAFTVKGTGVDYLADLEGKTVATGPPGDAGHTYFRIYCLVNGIDWESIEARRVGGEEAFRLLDQGRAAGMVTGGFNNTLGPQAQQWLQRQDNAKLVVPESSQRTIRLSNAGKHIDSLGWKRGGIIWELTLEQFKHAWKNSAVPEKKSYKTVAGTNTHFATLEMDDETAKRITTIAIEKRESLMEATGLWAGFAQEPARFAPALTPADAEASPWHPGAAEALKEKDMWNDEFAIASR